MTEQTLETAVEEARARVLELEARLAKRRQAEAAELELLESQRAEYARRLEQARQALTTARAQASALTLQAQQLQQGLSQGRRLWVRIAEPALAGVLLLASLVLVGAAWPQQLRMVVLELAGLVTGGIAAAAWSTWRGRA